jgi:hypothetical protein
MTRLVLAVGRLLCPAPVTASSAVRRNVTFSARQYPVNGERRSFALLPPISESTAQEKTRELVLEAYDKEVSGQNPSTRRKFLPYRSAPARPTPSPSLDLGSPALLRRLRRFTMFVARRHARRVFLIPNN